MSAARGLWTLDIGLRRWVSEGEGEGKGEGKGEEEHEEEELVVNLAEESKDGSSQRRIKTSHNKRVTVVAGA